MIKPTSVHAKLNRKTSMLYFDDRDPMECFMRGGICWPIPYEHHGQIDTNGYVVMAGMDVKTKIAYVFEQKQWVTIDNILDPETNQIRYLGLSHWFNRIWNEYFAQRYYFNQPYELSKQFRLQILRSNMIKPKPKMKELPPIDITDVLSVIWRMVKEGRVKYAKGSKLEEQLKMVKAGDKQMLPAVHAFGCCLVGLERYPWKKPFERPIEEILIK